MPQPDNSPIRGKWCHRCNGIGSLGWNEHITARSECPDCKWVGFVGVTSEQVREAELMASGMLPVKTTPPPSAQESLL